MEKLHIGLFTEIAFEVSKSSIKPITSHEKNQDNISQIEEQALQHQLNKAGKNNTTL